MSVEADDIVKMSARAAEMSVTNVSAVQLIPKLAIVVLGVLYEPLNSN